MTRAETGHRNCTRKCFRSGYVTRPIIIAFFQLTGRKEQHSLLQLLSTMGCSYSCAAEEHLASATRPNHRCFDWQRAEDTDSLRVIEKQAQRDSERSGEVLTQYRPPEPHPLVRHECTITASESVTSSDC
jgi:hypothetical protein